MGNNTLIAGVCGLVLGLAVGFIGANYLNSQQSNVATISQTGQDVANLNPAATSPVDPKMLEDVQKTIDKAKASPEDKLAQLEAGEMYFKIQKHDEALEFFKKAYMLDPSDGEVNQAMAKTFFEKKDFPSAAKHFEMALKAAPNEPGLHSDLGLSFYLREPKEVETAIKHYNKALSLNDRFEPALQNLAIAQREKGDAEGLKKTLETLRDVNSNNPALKTAN